MGRDDTPGGTPPRRRRSARLGPTGSRTPSGRRTGGGEHGGVGGHPPAHRVRLSEVRRPGSPAPGPDDSPTVAFPRDALAEEISFTRVRPYVRTGGRTRTRTVLDVATLVSVPRPRPAIVHPEHVAIEEVCAGPRSVAEVAARMSVPLGVARVLIDDMAALGFLLIHRSPPSDAAPAQDFMARVLEGLRRL